MDEAAFEHIETLTNRLSGLLARILHRTYDPELRQRLIAEIDALDKARDKARAEQKGGT